MSSATNDQASPSYAAPLGGLTAYLSLSDASEASAVYQRAFGAEEVAKHPVDDQGRTMHIHLYINGSSLMLSDAYPEFGHALEQPAAFNLTLQVDDIDAWWKRAVDAGVDVVMPVQEMFWGDRYGQLRDKFGVMWSMNQAARK